MKDKYLEQAKQLLFDKVYDDDLLKRQTFEEVIANLLKEIKEYQDNIKQHCRQIVELERERDEFEIDNTGFRYAINLLKRNIGLDSDSEDLMEVLEKFETIQKENEKLKKQLTQVNHEKKS